MIAKMQLTCAAASVALMLSACGGSDATPRAATSSKLLATVGSSSACPALTLNGIDAQTLTGDSTPLQMGTYGTRRPGAPVLLDGKHDPSNYRAAPVLPVWQFATTDPTNGVLTFECDVAPSTG